jgi:hypothetical protein
MFSSVRLAMIELNLRTLLPAFGETSACWIFPKLPETLPKMLSKFALRTTDFLAYLTFFLKRK